jgi:HPt (histidine-containing phosphotransfer) domain-containing protein
VNEPVDLQRIRRICNGDRAFERELVAMYIADAEARLAHLREAVKDGAAELARREAHTIKGASSNMGAGDMQQHALAVEELCRDGSIADSLPALDALDTTFVNTRAFLQRYSDAGETDSPSGRDASQPG